MPIRMEDGANPEDGDNAIQGIALVIFVIT